MGKARNFKFGAQIDLSMSHHMDAKIPQKGRSGVHGQNFKFWAPAINV